MLLLLLMPGPGKASNFWTPGGVAQPPQEKYAIDELLRNLNRLPNGADTEVPDGPSMISTVAATLVGSSGAWFASWFASEGPGSHGQIEADLLDPLQLSEYAHHFTTAGYVFITDLVVADKAEVDELLKVCAMKPPEARRFRMALERIGQTIALADDPSGESSGHNLAVRNREDGTWVEEGLDKPEL